MTDIADRFHMKGFDNIVDKTWEFMEKKRKAREQEEDIKERMEALLTGYETGKTDVNAVREERRKIRGVYLRRVQAGRPYDEDYLNDVQTAEDQIVTLLRENGEYDPEQDVLSS